MTILRLDDLRQHSDVLRSRTGETITVRFVEPRDAEVLQNYFRGLSSRSRYNRFFGAISELPPALLDRFIHVGELDQFSVVATMQVDGFETIVGDALRSNDPMIGLARKSGYGFTKPPGDWKLIRFEKLIDLAPQDIPCASWRLAAASRHVSPAAVAG